MESSLNKIELYEAFTELNLQEEYVSFAVFSFFTHDEELEEQREPLDTISEESIQRQIDEIENNIRRQHTMDILFRAVMLEILAVVIICAIVWFYVGSVADEIEPTSYNDAICRLIFCVIAHLMC